MAMKSWIDFWNSDTPIYVNARHKSLHYEAIARDMAGLIDHAGSVVLDHGCGEALSADLVADKAARLLLCDAAALVRGRLTEKFSHEAKIAVLAPEDVTGLPDASIDLIVANSIAQYLTADELDALLRLWRRLLRPGGRLILADILPPRLSPLIDALALLRFGWQGGFFGPAMAGLVRTFFSDYRRLRGTLGLKSYEPVDLIARMNAAGFVARRLTRNLGHNQARLAFEGRISPP